MVQVTAISPPLRGQAGRFDVSGSNTRVLTLKEVRVHRRGGDEPILPSRNIKRPQMSDFCDVGVRGSAPFWGAL
jgi:hypothetical protein